MALSARLTSERLIALCPQLELLLRAASEDEEALVGPFVGLRVWEMVRRVQTVVVGRRRTRISRVPHGRFHRSAVGDGATRRRRKLEGGELHLKPLPPDGVWRQLPWLRGEATRRRKSWSLQRQQNLP